MFSRPRCVQDCAECDLFWLSRPIVDVPHTPEKSAKRGFVRAVHGPLGGPAVVGHVKYNFFHGLFVHWASHKWVKWHTQIQPWQSQW